MDGRRLALSNGPGQRSLGWFVAISFALVSAGTFIAGTLLAAGAGAAGSWPAIIRLIVGLTLGLFACRAAPFAASGYWLSQRSNPQVRIEDGFLRIDDPSVFRQPALILRRQVAGVAVLDEGPGIGEPFVGSAPMDANVRLALEPMRFAEARNAERLNRDGMCTTPSSREHVGSLLLSFVDADAAVASIDRWLTTTTPSPGRAAADATGAIVRVPWWRQPRLASLAAVEGLVLLCWIVATGV